MSRSKYLSLILLLFITAVFSVPASVTGTIQKSNTNAIEEVPIEFAHTEEMSLGFEKTTVEATEFNGSEFIDQLDSFNETGVSIYTGSDSVPNFNTAIPGDGTLFYLTINVTETYIFTDQDTIGLGEIFFKIWGNGQYQRYPASGHISADDDTTIPMGVIAYEGWAWNGSIIVEVWDDDAPQSDDFLGRIEYSNISLSTPQTESLNTDAGHAIVTFTFSTTTTKTTASVQELLDAYKPYLYIDDETSGTEEPDGVYGRLCIGYDEEKGKDLWGLQYYFFWEKETYGTSPLVYQVHQYDYEEVLIFLDPSDISTPVRVVYDQAQSVVLPEHEYVIYEVNPSGTGGFSKNISFVDNLHPFLGTNLTIDYIVSDMNQLASEFFPGSLGSSTVRMTIDTFYHAFDKGEGANMTGYNYIVQELTNDVLKDWYSHLNESLHNTIINIPVISYTTPETSPFTFDPTNPFKEPYIKNAWSNVMDDLEAFSQAQTQDVTVAAELKMRLTLAMDGLLAIEYPQVVTPGNSYQLTFSLDLNSDSMTLMTEYELAFNVSTNFWFFGSDLNLFQNGTFEVDIPLGQINSLLDSLGVSPQDLGERIADKANRYLSIFYLEIDDITISPVLLGQILEASLRLHLWEIMKDSIPTVVNILAPEFGPAVEIAFWVLDWLISYIDLRAEFNLFATVQGDLAVSDPSQASLSDQVIIFDDSGATVTVPLDVDDNPTNPNFVLTMSNFANGLNFFIDWFFEAGLETPFDDYIPDFGVSLGKFPNYQATLPEGLISANVTTIPLAISIEGISSSTIPTSTTPTSTSPGFASLLLILSLGTLIGFRRRR
ncbi:MAG: hypothetical protein ACW98I_19505 [Candidatus Hodarchaeales archaeon]|jgi:hypothetical protein